MKILHLSGSKHHWSGNEQQLVDLIDNLPQHETQSFIFCYEGSAIEQYAKKHDIVCFSQKRRSIYSPLLAVALKRCVEENQIDVIHAHTSNFLTVYMIADLLFHLHRPTVFSRKGFSEKSGFFSHCKYNYRGIDSIICVSNAVKENMKLFLSHENFYKLHTIYDGLSIKRCSEQRKTIDLRKKYGLHGQLLLGNIANHVNAKDLPTLIRTISYLKNELKQDNFHLIQIGKKTALTPFLEKMAAENGVSDLITFTDAIEDADFLLNQFDLLVMSSQSEGLPLVVYAAFYYRVPVVTTDAGGIPEIVHHKTTGLLSRISDSKTLAKNMAWLMEDLDLREKIRQQAHNLFIEQFTAAKCAESTWNLYSEIIQNKKSCLQ